MSTLNMYGNVSEVMRMPPRSPMHRSSGTRVGSFVEAPSYSVPKNGPATHSPVRETPIEMLMQVHSVQTRSTRAVSNDLQVVTGNARSFSPAQGAEQVHH